MTYTYVEKMAFEVALQTAKTAVYLMDGLTEDQKELARKAIEDRANECHSDLRVLEPARTNLNNNPN